MASCSIAWPGSNKGALIAALLIAELEPATRNQRDQTAHAVHTSGLTISVNFWCKHTRLMASGQGKATDIIVSSWQASHTKRDEGISFQQP